MKQGTMMTFKVKKVKIKRKMHVIIRKEHHVDLKTHWVLPLLICLLFFAAIHLSASARAIYSLNGNVVQQQSASLPRPLPIDAQDVLIAAREGRMDIMALPRENGKMFLFPFSHDLVTTPPQGHSFTDSAGASITSNGMHDRIYIDGNADFARQAQEHGWPGDGSPSNPYIIEDLVIIVDLDFLSAIEIWNTDVHFIIRNCTVISREGVIQVGGFSLYNVTNGVLMNNVAYNYLAGYGFFLAYSSDIKVINNTVYDSSGGIIVYYSSNITVTNNTAYNNKGGFSVSRTDNTTVINNIACNNHYGFFLSSSSNTTVIVNNIACSNSFGFYLSSSRSYTLINNTAHDNHHGFILVAYFSSTVSSNNTLINNTAANNKFEGFGLYSYDGRNSNNTFINNSAFNNSERGFYLKNSDNNTFINNTASNNTWHGVYLDAGSSGNVIMYNAFFFNNNGSTQAYSDNADNVFDYNYWSDHTSPDADGDGIVDVPYSLDGSGGVTDPHPVTNPFYHPVASSTTTTITAGSTSFDVHGLIMAFILLSSVSVTWGRCHQRTRQKQRRGD